jgi:hypothetical protein
MLGGQPAKKSVTFKNSANSKNTTRKNAPTLTDNVPKKLMPGEGVLIDVQRVLDKNPKPYFLKVGTFRIYGKDPKDVVVQTGKLHPKTLTTGDLHVKTIKKGTLTPKKQDEDSKNSSKNSPKQLQLTNSEKKAPAKYSTRNSNTGNKKAPTPAPANSPGIEDPYAVLGLTRSATAEMIGSAYRKKILTAHPDKGGSTEEAAAVNLAYGILNNAGKRKVYDKYGMSGLKDAGLAGGARRKLASRKKFKR